jgi:hypothetical protein
MPELVAVINVRLAMIFDIFARAFDSISKTLALDVGKLLWRRIPVSLILSATRLRRSSGQSAGYRGV